MFSKLSVMSCPLTLVATVRPVAKLKVKGRETIPAFAEVGEMNLDSNMPKSLVIEKNKELGLFLKFFVYGR